MRKIFEEVSTKIFGKFFTFRPTAVFFLPVATNLIFVSDLCFNFHQFSFLLHKSMLFSFLCLFNS